MFLTPALVAAATAVALSIAGARHALRPEPSFLQAAAWAKVPRPMLSDS